MVSHLISVSGECPVSEERSDEWYRAEVTRETSMNFVYVLLSDFDNKFYIGFTDDVERRLKDHNSGKVPSTAPRRPFKVIYYEAHLSKDDALRREEYFKTAKGKTTLKQILRNSLVELSLA